MKLTRNFNLAEFAVSADHPYLASLITFSESDKIKLFYFCALVLQPMRDWFGPTTILSGKRTHELNNAIPGASPTSDHLFRMCSCATDFTCPGVDMEKVFLWLKCNRLITPDNRQKYGQLIFYPSKNFVHVSLPTPKHHGEAFINKSRGEA